MFSKFNLACLKTALFFTASINLISCSTEETISSSLNSIQNILLKNNAGNTVQYNLTTNVDFPCQVTLEENWIDADTSWYQVYRFDLTDIEKNTFIQSKAGRRAIVYSGYKETSDKTKKIFSEIRINNLQYRADLLEKNQVVVLTEMNKAIALCEEKYNF